MRLFSLAAAVMFTGCVPDSPEELGSYTSELAADTRVIYNVVGQPRYVKSNSQEVKLYMTDHAMTWDDPKHGFRNSNHFHDSCAPTAAINAFNWYGIVQAEGQRCYWHTESEPGAPSLPPEWVCEDRVNAWSLGNAMGTNTWRVLTVQMPGTSTSNFRSVYKPYIDRWITLPNQYQYKYEEYDAAWRYKVLWASLAQGHPVVVNYKTGTIDGHFALIVGMEKAGDPASIFDDRILMANARLEKPYTKWVNGTPVTRYAMTYGEFAAAWARNYIFNVPGLIGEQGYTRINVWDTSKPLPAPPSGGGGGGGSDPPVYQN